MINQIIFFPVPTLIINYLDPKINCICNIDNAYKTHDIIDNKTSLILTCKDFYRYFKTYNKAKIERIPFKISSNNSLSEYFKIKHICCFHHIKDSNYKEFINTLQIVNDNRENTSIDVLRSDINLQIPFEFVNKIKNKNSSSPFHGKEYSDVEETKTFIKNFTNNIEIGNSCCAGMGFYISFNKHL